MIAKTAKNRPFCSDSRIGEIRVSFGGLTGIKSLQTFPWLRFGDSLSGSLSAENLSPALSN
jgi:hypothetical protein